MDETAALISFVFDALGLLYVADPSTISASLRAATEFGGELVLDILSIGALGAEVERLDGLGVRHR
ncbi:hypothetical protein [Curtobacterium sp. MCSS17_005]|uniref:hypothetical protein n=1 Tax=Curtobacterium sp. MCSS17_005 TaxID=2175641 RepID=UPI0011B5DC98|nr:hypothetical protein [Curtobacterium sp. MCSS17_005]WIB34401.1 hypothetical protein DEJ20_08020 [Curtobacterium sp. MCSS17_005]